MQYIIGLVGEKESGKTTTFRFIKEKIPNAQEVMLAEHLKEVCSTVFKMELYKFESQAEKQKTLKDPVVLTHEQLSEAAKLFGLILSEEDYKRHIGKILKTTRQILQYIGTDVLRSVEDDIHLKWAMKKAPKADVYVVTDIRFHNEFEYFSKLEHFLPISIIREKSERSADEASMHVSEQQVQELQKKCSEHIKNGSSLEDLQNQVDRIIVSFMQSMQKRQ